MIQRQISPSRAVHCESPKFVTFPTQIVVAIRCISDQPGQRLGILAADNPQLMTACDIDLNRTLCGPGVSR